MYDRLFARIRSFFVVARNAFGDKNIFTGMNKTKSLVQMNKFSSE